jgi:hypothetical protein
MAVFKNFYSPSVNKAVNLLIRDSILNPPTSLECFRQLTFFVTTFKHSVEDVLIETNKETLDFYYKYLKNAFVLDYVEDFILFNDNIAGLRIDNEFRFYPTIYTEYIKENNLNILINSVNNNAV